MKRNFTSFSLFVSLPSLLLLLFILLLLPSSSSSSSSLFVEAQATTTTTAINSSLVNGTGDGKREVDSEFQKAAAAFFSSALVSAAALSAVAFGLSRSQECAEFYTLAAEGRCVFPNASVVPIFADAPFAPMLGEMGADLCGYYGTTVISNLGASIIALSVGIAFGGFTIVVRRKCSQCSWYRLFNKGYFFVIYSNVVGLFLTPTITASIFCTVRPGGAMWFRVICGILAFLLFFAIPYSFYRPLLGLNIPRDGKFEFNERVKKHSMARKIFIDFLFGGKEWTYVPHAIRERQFRDGSDGLDNTLASTSTTSTQKALEEFKFGDAPPASSPKEGGGGDDDNDLEDLLNPSAASNKKRSSIHHVTTSGEFDEVDAYEKQRFNAFLPLFEDMSDRQPHFLFYDVIVQSLFGICSPLSEIFATNPDPTVGCGVHGAPMFILLFMYFCTLIWRRPLEQKILLLATMVVSALQGLVVFVGLFMVTMESSPSWATGLDVIMIMSQAGLSLVGLLLAGHAAMSGGCRKLKKCCCPQRDDKEDEEEEDDDDDEKKDGSPTEIIAEMSAIASGEQQQKEQQQQEKEKKEKPSQKEQQQQQPEKKEAEKKSPEKKSSNEDENKKNPTPAKEEPTKKEESPKKETKPQLQPTMSPRTISLEDEDDL